MRNIVVCVILVACSALVARAQEVSNRELFRRVIQRKDIKKITQLIDDGFDLNLRSDHKRTLLFEVHYAYDFNVEFIMNVAAE
jgi:hypothetical protein